MFQILESKEAKIAAGGTLVLFTILYFLVNLQLLQGAVHVAVPFLIALIGVALGWVAGEAIAKTPGWGKAVWSLITLVFGAKVSTDAFEASAGGLREKVVYILGFIPIADPVVKSSLLWGVGGFWLFTLLSLGINWIRQNEK